MNRNAVVIAVAASSLLTVGRADQKAGAIADSEPNRLTGSVLGWRLRLDSPVGQAPFSSKYTANAMMTATRIRYLKPAGNLKDSFEPEARIDRSVYAVLNHNGANLYELRSNGEARIDGSYEGKPSKRLSYEVKVTKYRTYEDSFVLKNVHIKVAFSGNKAESGKPKPCYYAVSCDNPNITTPGGIKLRLFDSKPAFGRDDNLHLRFRFTQQIGLTNLKTSPLKKGTNHPVRIAIMRGQSFMYDGTDFGLDMPMPGLKRTKDWIEPQLKVTLLHRADIESKTIRMLAPTKIVKTLKELNAQR